MDKQELLKRLTDTIGRLDDEGAHAAAEALKQTDCTFEEVLGCLNQGLKLVGSQFEQGEYFIADLMYSGILYCSILDSFSFTRPASLGGEKGKILAGVVEKDIHDIGKDIIVSLLRADGFEVIDLGVNVPPQTFVEQIRLQQPQIVILSGMMRFAQDSMRRTVEAIQQAGLRDQVHILLGGGCVDRSILKHVDADACATEPADTIKACNRFLERRRT